MSPSMAPAPYPPSPPDPSTFTAEELEIAEAMTHFPEMVLEEDRRRRGVVRWAQKQKRSALLPKEPTLSTPSPPPLKNHNRPAAAAAAAKALPEPTRILGKPLPPERPSTPPRPRLKKHKLPMEGQVPVPAGSRTELSLDLNPHRPSLPSLLVAVDYSKSDESGPSENNPSIPPRPLFKKPKEVTTVPKFTAESSRMEKNGPQVGKKEEDRELQRRSTGKPDHQSSSAGIGGPAPAPVSFPMGVWGSGTGFTLDLTVSAKQLESQRMKELRSEKRENGDRSIFPLSSYY